MYVAVGSGGAVWIGDGSSFTTLPQFLAADLRDVWISPTGDTWLVGNTSSIQHLQPDGGRAVVDAPVAGLYGVVGWRGAAGGPTQLWLTGDNGAVLTLIR